MRRARRVIAFFLMLFLAESACAQQAAPPSESSVDTDVTIMGRDDSIIPVPEPENVDEELVLPAIDTEEAGGVYVPVLLPPVTDTLTLPPVEIRESADLPRAPGK